MKLNKQDGVLVYSTMAGDLPKMVEQGIPKCFVCWETYLELKKECDEIKARVVELVK